MKIGAEVCAVFFAQKKRAKVFKVDSIEPEGTFRALSYPKTFHVVIDKIILKHCLPIAEQPQERQKRPRLNKVYSSNPKKL